VAAVVVAARVAVDVAAGGAVVDLGEVVAAAVETVAAVECSER
jgi:hypothetical protein